MLHDLACSGEGNPAAREPNRKPRRPSAASWTSSCCLPRPAGTEPAIELRDNLAAMLGTTVQSRRAAETEALSLQVSIVAGEGPPVW